MDFNGLNRSRASAWFRAIGLPVTILMFLTSCADRGNTDWSTVLPTATGGGILPYLIGAALNDVMRSDSSESFVISDICDRARDGDPASRASVAWHYRNGWAPVSADPVEAYKWFTLADNSGYTDAIRFRTELADEMTAEQITEGENLAAAWSADDEECEFTSETATDSPTD